MGVGSSGARWLLDQLHYLWVISQSICPSATHLIPREQKCGLWDVGRMQLDQVTWVSHASNFSQITSFTLLL